jgi:hypothetical protein
MVICLLRVGENNCTDQNILLILKPENAQQPQAVIEKILIFAKFTDRAMFIRL